MKTWRHPDLTGQTFGRLKVLKRAGTKGKQTAWECICSCGRAVVTVGGSLRGGTSRSCGCLREDIRPTLRRTHGLEHTREYATWLKIKGRCHCPTDKSFPYYGARGIVVCDRWCTSFEAFYADMGPRPSRNYSIERKDNDGPYSPENCVWATSLEQNRNRRNIRPFTFNGETRPLFEWAEVYGFQSWQVLDNRLRKGWTIERTLTTPLRRWPVGQRVA